MSNWPKDCRKQHLFWFVLCLALFMGAGAYFLSRGFSARTQPSAIEEFIARRLRLIAIPRNARELTDPVTPTAEVMANGMAHFADHCAVCHGNDGSGDTDFGRGLYPKPPDMRQVKTQNLTDGELYYIIQNGIRFTGMPAFGEGETEHDEDSWGLVHFIRLDDKAGVSTDLKVGLRVVIDAKMDPAMKMYKADQVKIGVAAPAAGKK